MMSDLDLPTEHEEQHARDKRGRGAVAVLLALAVFVAVGLFAYVKGVDYLRDALDRTPVPDYAGPGHGSVVVEVKEGDTTTDIARTLEDADVVKSRQAFVDAAAGDERALSIQVGHYQLREQMSAVGALKLLVNPDNRMTNLLTIPEGKRVAEILDLVAKGAEFKRAAVLKAASRPAALGLPAYAGGEMEGYLFPATYDITPKMTPLDALKAMVARFSEEATAQGLQEASAQLGYSPRELVIVASLVQSEASRPEDMAKVARVVYNRLAIDMPLQFDSTLHYEVDSRGEVVAGRDLTEMDSPYNSYKLAGLPPTAISAPGADALEAALHPAEGDWLYFVTVDLATGETKFADDLHAHNRNRQLYFEYCQTSDEC
jgi:UPF0755 protein